MRLCNHSFFEDSITGLRVPASQGANLLIVLALLGVLVAVVSGVSTSMVKTVRTYPERLDRVRLNDFVAELEKRAITWVEDQGGNGP